MQFQIQDSYDPLSPEDIAQFEKELNATLPTDYRDFLLEHNGGSFADEVAYTYEESGGCAGAIGHFYGLNAALIGYDLRQEISSLQQDLGARAGECLPREVIPVAHTPGGEIVLGIEGDARGEVYWWCPEDGTENRWERLSYIAGSFNAFLDGLVPDPDAEDLRESLPAFRAAEAGDVETLRTMLDEGANVDERNAEGKTLLIAAARYSRVNAVRFLFDRGADVTERDRDGDSALHLAFSSDTAKAILQGGANPNGLNNVGRTPLMRAVEYNRAHIAMILLNGGADPNIEANDGTKALSLCCGRGETRAMLLSAGATE